MQEVKHWGLRSINSVRGKEELFYKWKEFIAVPVFKKGDKTSNYRGISLLSTSYKIVFSNLPSKLSRYTCIDKIIGDHQCGFQRNRSTIIRFLHSSDIAEKMKVQ
jgi:hypothetical protein